MMNKVLKYFIIIMLVWNQNVLAQQQDSLKNRIINNSKLLLFHEFKDMGADQDPLNYIEKKVIAREISHKGFNETIYFIQLYKSEDSIFYNDSSNLDNIGPIACEYIVAYNTMSRMYYRVKGFRLSDIEDLFKTFSKFSPGNPVSHALNRNDIKDLRLLYKSDIFWIQRMNMTCLIDYLIGIYKYKHKNIDPPTCISSCFHRDFGRSY